MNRKLVLFAALYGAGMTVVFFRPLLPKETAFYLPVEGSSDQSEEIAHENAVVLVERQGEELIKVSIKPDTPWPYYLTGSIFAFLSCYFQYQTSKEEAARKNENEFQEPAPETQPDDDPLYERFLAEDESRRLVPRAVLEKDFGEWKAREAWVENPERNSSL